MATSEGRDMIINIQQDGKDFEAARITGSGKITFTPGLSQDQKASAINAIKLYGITDEQLAAGQL